MSWLQHWEFWLIKSISNPVNLKIKLNYISRVISYGAVNTVRLAYKNQPANVYGKPVAIFVRTVHNT